VFFTQLADVIDIARNYPGLNLIMGHVGGVLGYGPYAGRRDEVFASWKASVTELAAPFEMHEAGRYDDAGGLMTTRRQNGRSRPRSWRQCGGPYRDLHRAVRAQALHVRKQFSLGWRRWASAGSRLWNARSNERAAGASVDEKLALFR
jgi:hypothetical protein